MDAGSNRHADGLTYVIKLGDIVPRQDAISELSSFMTKQKGAPTDDTKKVCQFIRTPSA
jgi:hypothetical protein